MHFKKEREQLGMVINLEDKQIGVFDWDVPLQISELLNTLPEAERRAFQKKITSMIAGNLFSIAHALQTANPNDSLNRITRANLEVLKTLGK